MKWIFMGVLLVAITLSVICSLTKPKDEHPGVVASLVWATDGNPARQEQMELFKKWHLKHYGKPIDIKTDPSNGGRDKVIIQSIAGAGSDLFDTYNSADLERYVKSGVILDVTEVAKEKGFGPDTVWKGLWPSLMYNGRQYSFPDNTADYLLIYHKELFDQHHIPYPKPGWTWDDFMKVAVKFSFKDSKGMRHFALTSFNPLVMIYSNGAMMYTPNGTECIINSPDARYALQYYRDMQQKYHILPTASEVADMASAGGWGSGDINLFGAKGEKYFAMAYGGRWWYVQWAQSVNTEKDGDKLFNLGVVTVPKFKYDYQIASARCTAVNRNSKNAKYAVRFLEFLASEEFNRQVNGGYDSISGAKKYCEAPYSIGDDRPAPKGLESVNDPLWVDAMNYAHEFANSPFIPTYKMQQYWDEEKGKLDATPDETPEEMLAAFQKKINDAIQRNISIDPKLAKLYKECKKKDEQWKKDNGGKL